MKKIDLVRVAQLRAKMAGKEPPANPFENPVGKKYQMLNITPDPGLESNSHLFFYKSKYYHIQGSLKKLAEMEVDKLLKDIPETKIYFVCAQFVCAMPSVLASKTKEPVKVKDDTEAVSFMSGKSGVKITVKDL